MDFTASFYFNLIQPTWTLKTGFKFVLTGKNGVNWRNEIMGNSW